jgi:hypothetical protein
LTAGGEGRSVANDMVGGKRQHHSVLVTHLRECRAGRDRRTGARRTGSSNTSARH